jgi:hypothetical protein
MFTLTAQEIGQIMMAFGYAVTLITIGRIILNAMVAFYNKVLLPVTNHLMERYAPKWLKILDLKLQGWLALPAWISWKMDDLLVTALERMAVKYRAVNDRKAAQLLVEMEDYNARYFEVTNSK